MPPLVGGWDAGEVAVLLGLVAFVGVVERWLPVADGIGTEESRGVGLFKGVMGSESMSDEFLSAVKGDLGSSMGIMVERSGGVEEERGGACIEAERGTLELSL